MLGRVGSRSGLGTWTWTDWHLVVWFGLVRFGARGLWTWMGATEGEGGVVESSKTNNRRGMGFGGRRRKGEDGGAGMLGATQLELPWLVWSGLAGDGDNG
ncbi:hypothetical protein LZ31DRAFT_390103 [Colletotrichum somersetense]|nr:hypothetical protein LZ31DRAFT_390103 [Colletotrichum somersetense]